MKDKLIINPPMTGNEETLNGLRYNGQTYKVGAGGGGSSSLVFANVVVQTSAFVSDATYQDYPYAASITLSGVTASMFPIVVFAPDDANGGNYAPICSSYAGCVKIYAKAIPSASIIIPQIFVTG